MCIRDRVEASDIGVINVQDISTFVEVLNNKGDMVLKACLLYTSHFLFFKF